ncbi:helix-turn-helix domain-containing protein [Patescibacteria group bacterium]|nr:helix-turn-helix domain-containing protein [Patescibacteria group bacterium]
MNNLYSIRQVAEILGKNIITLRRWEKAGKLMSVRSNGGHRYYQKDEIERFLSKQDIFKMAQKWVKAKDAKEPADIFYCPTSDVFKIRLIRLEKELMSYPKLKELYSLIIALAGEIGNNSYDHNLGNWPDVLGIFFGHNVQTRQIILADRGLGVLATLKTIKPELNNHYDALKVAFTETVTSRSPEHRGNGLKFVREVIANYDISLIFETGNARLKIGPRNGTLHLRRVKKSIHGCLALIQY